MVYEHILYVPDADLHHDVAKFVLRLSSTKIQYENRKWSLDGKECDTDAMYRYMARKFVFDLEKYINYANEKANQKKIVPYTEQLYINRANEILNRMSISAYRGYLIKEMKYNLLYMKANNITSP